MCNRVSWKEGLHMHISAVVYALNIICLYIHDMSVCDDVCLGECVVVVRVACC